ncbi:transmembrane protein 160-like [Haliotis asinina]|uniref:transmembrane protein 160-like n=1 Tax=Haliotis asinina TaxID=109174 RepID=UPI003531D285
MNAMKGLTKITQMVKSRTPPTCFKQTLCHYQSFCSTKHGAVSFRLVTNTHDLTSAVKTNSIQLQPPHTKQAQISLYQCVPSRQIATTSMCLSRSSIGVGVGQSDEDTRGTHTKEQGVTDAAWAIRLANENGYLSWCRNTYLASAVACGMQAEGTLEVSQLAAQGVFLLAGINMTWGTINFIIYILKLRQRMGMSLLASLINITGAIFHLLVWLALVTMYLGLAEEPPETPDGEEV